MLQRRFQLFDGAYLGETRTCTHQPGKLGKLFRRSYGVYFDAAVGQISGPAAYTESIGGMLNKGAKTHTLHASVDLVFACGFQGFVSG